MNEIINTLLEVKLNDANDFLKIRETLTRIGIASKKDNSLFQSAHILHKQGRYYIVHFKELFILDGKPSNFNAEDKARRNTIAKLLEEWNLLKIVNKAAAEPSALMNQIKVIPFKEKDNWNLVAKYQIGKKVKKEDE